MVDAGVRPHRSQRQLHTDRTPKYQTRGAVSLARARPEGSLDPRREPVW
jgi:hypothetical protein